MTVRPYTTREHVIEGVIITWLDIDAVRRQGSVVPHEAVSAMLEAVGHSAAVLDADLRLVEANAAWRRTFRDTPAAGPAVWKDSSLALALREVSAGGDSVQDRVVSLEGSGGPVTVRLSALPLPVYGSAKWILVVAKDLPDRSE